MRPTRIRDLKMKKTVLIIVVVMAITTGLFAQNSNTLQVESVIETDLKAPSSNLSTALAGKVPGIISCQNQDSIKGCVEIMIGGPNCPGCNGLSRTTPLILIDGLEVSQNVLTHLKPKDIKSLSVLKDAKALEMYGKDGSNGVIIITSKLKSKDLKKMIKKTKKQKEETKCLHTTGGLAQAGVLARLKVSR